MEFLKEYAFQVEYLEEYAFQDGDPEDNAYQDGDLTDNNLLIMSASGISLKNKVSFMQCHDV